MRAQRVSLSRNGGILIESLIDYTMQVMPMIKPLNSFSGYQIWDGKSHTRMCD